ncbi:hypothetical protein EXS71_04985 [Candidatus Uhrbacteria bacterium]|nr:hypothetical protein [Candidatus Uhrbacteria bacterium]
MLQAEDTMTATDEGLSRFFETAEEMVRRAQERLGYTTGGFICLIGMVSPVPITTTRIGEMPIELEGQARRDAEREASHLFANPLLRINAPIRLSENSGFGGAAIRTHDHILAFCGYGPMQDLVMTLAITMQMRWLSAVEAFDILPAGESLIQLDALVHDLFPAP